MKMNKKGLLFCSCAAIWMFFIVASAASALTAQEIYEKQIQINKYSSVSHKFDEYTFDKAGIKGSDYSFNINGNGELLWEYEYIRPGSSMDINLIGDIDGNGICDMITCNNWNGNGTLFTISSETGNIIWTKEYDQKIATAGSIGDTNGDGINDHMIYSDSYDTATNLTIEVVEQSSGTTIWTSSSSIEGEWYICGMALWNDFNGDGVNDALFKYFNWELKQTHLDAVSGKDGSLLWRNIIDGGLSVYIPLELPDLNGDGTGDYVISVCPYDDSTEYVTALNGKDGSTLWTQSFVSYWLWSDMYIDINNNGIVDVVVGGYDYNNNISSIFMIEGSNGNTIWNNSYDGQIFFNSWFNDDIDNDGINDLVAGLETGYVQMLSGASGNMIWEKEYQTLYPGYSSDIDGDNKNEVIIVDYTKTDLGDYLYNVIVLSGINGDMVWESSFMHHIDIIPPENGTSSGSSAGSTYHDLIYCLSDNDGDGVPDPILNMHYSCSYWNQSTQNSEYYSSSKLVLINGTNGEELWDVEITSDSFNSICMVLDWLDFDLDGVNDVFFNTYSGLYVVKTTDGSPVNQIPAASFTFTPSSPSTNDVINFNASASSDPDGSIVSYDWDFGDGNTTSGISPQHQYTNNGTYNVTLTVTDNDSATNDATIAVTVTAPVSNNETVLIGSTTVDINDTAVVSVTIAEADNIQSMKLDILYDPELVTVMDITPDENIPLSSITYTTGTGITSIELTIPDSLTVTSATVLMDITFQAGNTSGTTTLEMQNTELTDDIGSHAPDMITNGSIAVCIKGDFNNNDVVDIGDVARVAFMVAGKVADDPRADFNKNGVVDIGDAAKISFFLADKIGEL